MVTTSNNVIDATKNFDSLNELVVGTYETVGGKMEKAGSNCVCCYDHYYHDSELVAFGYDNNIRKKG